MITDEQVDIIEQSSQEALRVRKEIRATETTEAQRRGLLFLEGAQIIIDQLQNDPDLVEMSRIPTDDPITSRRDPSGLDPIQLEEIIEPKKPEVQSPQIRASGGISTHPEISRTSSKKSVPHPLFDLITVYDEEDILEVSLVTPMHITEEKEPDKVSSPALDAPIQSFQQSD